MIQLDVSLEKFNKGRKVPLEVEKVSESYMFFTGEKRDKYKIGEISIVRNLSNCGIIDLHNLWGQEPKDVDLILEFMKFFAKYGGRNILTYNTATGQTPLRKSLKKAGFHTPRKTYKNINSGNTIQFHILAVT